MLETQERLLQGVSSTDSAEEIKEVLNNVRNIFARLEPGAEEDGIPAEDQ